MAQSGAESGFSLNSVVFTTDDLGHARPIQTNLTTLTFVKVLFVLLLAVDVGALGSASR